MALMDTGARLLIVDDSETILSILSEFFGVAYQIETATNAASALKAAVANRPSAILLDVNMPGGDGLTLLAAMRGRGITVPAFVMTGYDGPEVALRAKKSGATEFLRKPVDLCQLDRSVAAALHVKPILG